MERKFNSSKTMNGTFGKLWVNNELKGNVKSFEAKLTLNYESVDVSNSLGENNRYMGYSISGTMTFHKCDSNFISMYHEGIISGVLPEINVVASLDDPSAWGAERVQLTGVTFDEIQLMKFEQKTLTEESVPFKATAYRLLQKV